MEIYKSLRLLIETSEIWLKVDSYEVTDKDYDSVALLFIDKIKSLLSIMVPGFK